MNAEKATCYESASFIFSVCDLYPKPFFFTTKFMYVQEAVTLIQMLYFKKSLRFRWFQYSSFES